MYFEGRTILPYMGMANRSFSNIQLTFFFFPRIKSNKLV
jgi:hypothetical protein